MVPVCSVRVTEHIPGILNFVVTDGEGVPSLEAFHSAAPLMVLPAAARNEVHK